MSRPPRKIWIDLDNSPHVPFFVPIIQELKRRDYDVLLTSRDNAQVLELLNYNGLTCRHYGRHYGRFKTVKVLGLGLRSLQLAPLILREKPDLAVSHGSRSQIVLSTLLGIPCLAMTDYEHATMRMAGIEPQWLMVPEVVSENVRTFDRNKILTYPGIKEDVYVPRFRPTPGIREQLGLSSTDVVVTVRPPASDAHYHNPLSDDLFREVVEFLGQSEGVRMIVLPRSKRQEASLRQEWAHLFKIGKFTIPEHVVDGLNLMWFSDLVISAGGTMNREAAALGVPVYSIFKGKSAAVDRHLAAAGKLVFLETARDVVNIRLVRRHPPSQPSLNGGQTALASIIGNITAVLETSGHGARSHVAS